jgi:hypothetical protein
VQTTLYTLIEDDHERADPDEDADEQL